MELVKEHPIQTWWGLYSIRPASCLVKHLFPAKHNMYLSRGAKHLLRRRRKSPPQLADLRPGPYYLDHRPKDFQEWTKNSIYHYPNCLLQHYLRQHLQPPHQSEGSAFSCRICWTDWPKTPRHQASGKERDQFRSCVGHLLARNDPSLPSRNNSIEYWN